MRKAHFRTNLVEHALRGRRCNLTCLAAPILIAEAASVLPELRCWQGVNRVICGSKPQGSRTFTNGQTSQSLALSLMIVTQWLAVDGFVVLPDAKGLIPSRSADVARLQITRGSSSGQSMCEHRCAASIPPFLEYPRVLHTLFCASISLPLCQFLWSSAEYEVDRNEPTRTNSNEGTSNTCPHIVE